MGGAGSQPLLAQLGGNTNLASASSLPALAPAPSLAGLPSGHFPVGVQPGRALSAQPSASLLHRQRSYSASGKPHRSVSRQASTLQIARQPSRSPSRHPLTPRETNGTTSAPAAPSCSP